MPLKAKDSSRDSISQDKPCFHAETGTSVGITFHLPSRRRFIPYSWLLYTELNRDETELHLHYTHSIVIVTGSGLHDLQEKAECFRLCSVRETSPSSLESTSRASVTRIEITENASP
jgi:hypothetical protein